MNHKILSAIKFTVFLGIGIFLLWLAVRGQDLNRIWEASKEANFTWLGLSILLGFICLFIRALRWNLLIQPLGYRPRTINTFFAVLTGYFANLAFPRLGEVSKCGVLNKYEKIPIDRLLGTMIVERSFDMLALLILLFVIVIFQFHVLGDFINTSLMPSLKGKLGNAGDMLLYIGIVSGIAILLLTLFRKPLTKLKFIRKVISLFMGIWQGITSVKNLQHVWIFMLETILIWVFYFLMAYVGFFAFKETQHLDLWAGLSVLVFGSLGFVVPVQGGIGAYHYMASKTLIAYGIAPDAALAYAFLLHGAQTLMMIFFGFVSLILLPLVNKNHERPIKTDA